MEYDRRRDEDNNNTYGGRRGDEDNKAYVELREADLETNDDDEADDSEVDLDDDNEAYGELRKADLEKHDLEHDREVDGATVPRPRHSFGD